MPACPRVPLPIVILPLVAYGHAILILMKEPMQNQPPLIFDRHALKLHRERARKHFAAHSFLHQRIVDDLVDRLETIKRSFEHGVAVGPGASLLPAALTKPCNVQHLQVSDPVNSSVNDLDVDEAELPFAPASLDLYISLMSLHLINDLPGTLMQIRQALKPDGLFIGVLPGEETLTELKQALYKAEAEISGGVSPRVIPFAAIKDLGGLLQRAGFALPVADIDSVKVHYRSPFTLLQDLRGMGETNILANRHKKTLRRDVLTRAMQIYVDDFSDQDQKATATFDLITITGWAPHESQQKPLAPGSAKASMKEAVASFTKGDS
jgi:SAM-dependent methyltransferase